MKEREFIINSLRRLADGLESGKLECHGWEMRAGHKGKWRNGKEDFAVTTYDPEKDRVPRQHKLQLEEVT